MERPKRTDYSNTIVGKARFYCALEKYIDQLKQEKCVSREDCGLYFQQGHVDK